MLNGIYDPSDLSEQHDKGLITGFLLGVLISCMFIVIVHAVKPDGPRLVGYGCDGSTGPLFAYEEDHFPTSCTTISRY